MPDSINCFKFYFTYKYLVRPLSTFVLFMFGTFRKTNKTTNGSQRSCALLPHTEFKFKSMTLTDVQPQILRYNYDFYLTSPYGAT